MKNIFTSTYVFDERQERYKNQEILQELIEKNMAIDLSKELKNVADIEEYKSRNGLKTLQMSAVIMSPKKFNNILEQAVKLGIELGYMLPPPSMAEEQAKKAAQSIISQIS